MNRIGLGMLVALSGLLWAGPTRGDLVAHWPLDASGEDVAASFDGAASGGVTFGVAGASAFSGTAASFANGVVDVPFAPELNPESFTIALWARSTGADCEFCSGRSLVNCNITPLLAPRRSKPVPVLNIGRRRLTPNLEQVTCREPRVTPINSAISSRLFPLSTRFLICWILSGVNFVCLPRGSTWAVSSAVISGPSVHLFSVHLFCPRYICDYSLCCGPDLLAAFAQEDASE